VTKEGLSIAKSVVETKAELKLGALKIELGDKKGDINEAKVEGKDEIIKNLREDIKNKNAEIESLRKQVEKQTDKGQDNLLAAMEIMAKSRENSRASSPTPPAYYDKQ